jgi:hypothetical protein
MFGSSFVGEGFGMAIFTAEHAGMNGVTERGSFDPLYFESNLFRLHPFMATTAVAGNREGLGAIVAGATGFAFFHLGHGYSPFLADNDLGIMATSAFSTQLGKMLAVAEGDITGTGYFVIDVTWFAGMAPDAIFF